MKKLNFLVFVSMLILNLFWVSSYSFAEIIPPEKLVSQALDKTLMEMNNPYLRVIKQGSWISLENFRPITSANPSDFDSRLFLSHDVPKEEAFNIWKRFRSKLQKNIMDMAKKAGYDPATIGKIRALTNFYPPEQLMKNFSTTQEALDYFLNKGIYPSLGEVGEEGAEGLYSKYTKFVRQSFEKGKRVQVSQLILDEDGGYKIIHKSTAAAEHLIEGKAPKNITGFVQAAEHAIEESKKALKSGQFDIVEKQLKRASDALKEARTLVNASTESELLEKINSLENIFKNIRNAAFSEAGLEAGELVKKLDDIAKKLKPIEAELLVETNALKNLKDARNPKTRYLLKGLLDNDKKFIDLKSKLTTLSDDSISKGLNKEFAVWFGATLLDFWNLKQLDDAIKKGEVSSLNLIIPGIINYLVPPTTPIGWAVLFSEIYMAAVSLAIQYVESTGYFALIAGQDCMDLIAGIYTLKGREHRIFEKRCEEILDSQNLACRIYDHHGLRRHILKGYSMNPEFIPPLLNILLKCHSDNASIHYDEMNQSKHDERISRALVEKCTPIILQEWFEVRQIVVNDLDLLRQNLSEADLKISVKPNKISKNTTITLEAEENYADTLEREIKEKIRCLGGIHADPKFNRSYRWIVNGKVFSDTYKNKDKIFLKDAGTYEFCVDVKYDWYVTGLPNVSLEDGISGSVTKNACTQVVVADDKKDDLKTCTYTYSDWGECDSQSKKQTRRVISKSPFNCVEMDEPMLVQSCKPIAKEAPACAYQYSEWSACDETSKKQTRRVISRTPVNCIEKDKPMLEQSCTPVTKALPTCSFKYSEWGECSRATKKQTRSVISKEPAGCVENQKPAIEQGCTPPPTEEEKRHQYFNCLCRCSSGWAGHIGVWYDPEGKSKPECESSGPCFGGAGAFGCTRRHFFNAPNDCAKGCWESAFGKGTYDSDKANKLRKDENKKYAKPLTVKLKASKNPADFAEIVNLTAETAEGTGGYSYNWGGCAQDAKDASAKVLNTRTCQSCTASVTVTDQDGNSASDSITIQCNALKVKLKKELPKDNSVPVGGKASFYAEVFSGDKPASGSFTYIWERNPDAIFGDPKNPKYETQGGSQMRNTALFRKAGTTPVWVSVLKEVEGRKVTVGESEQIPIEVGNPELIITYTPKEPFIGQEVKLQVTTRPKMGDDIIGFWWEIPNYWTGTGDKASFKSKDSKPVKVIVHAKTKDGGDEVGTKDVMITAKGYQVSVSEPRYLESPPQMWQCDTQLGQAQRCGMVTLKPNQFVTHRDIFFKATVTPNPDSPRYRWTVDPSGSCGFPGSGSEIKINCSNTGTYTIKVEVTNADGAKLGEAAQAVTVSISQAQLDGAKKSKDAYDKMQQAKTLVQQGKLEEAISLSDDALKIEPTNTEAKTLSDKWKNDLQGIKKHIVILEQLLKDNKLTEAEKEFQSAQRINAKHQLVIEAENRLKAKKDEINKKKAEAQRLKAEGEALERQGKLQDAVNKYKESIKIIPDKPLDDNIRKLETQIAQNKQKKQTADRLWDECSAFAKQNRLQEALVKCKESLNHWSDDKRNLAVRELERQVNQESQKKAAADRLWDECAALAKQGRNQEALGKCRESLNYWSSDKRIAAVKDLENTVNQETQKKATADRLWDECSQLAKQNRLLEALVKCKESLKYWSSDKRLAVVRDMEQQTNQANQKREQCKLLMNEGYQLKQEGRLKEALAKYEEAQRICPNAETEQTISSIINSITTSRDFEGIWEVSFNNYRGKMELQRVGSGWSGRLWLDAHRSWEQLTNISYSSSTGRLEFTRPISGATQRYSGALSADRMEGTFTQENYSGTFKWWAKRTGAVTPAGIDTTGAPASASPYYHVDLTPYGGKRGAPRKVKNIEVDDGSWIRLKATHEKKLNLDISLPAPVSANSIAIISNLDNAHHVKDDVTTTVLTVYTKSGNHRFEIKAGVHSSEWNRGETGGADHHFPKENHLGDKRWLAVFNLPQGSVVIGMRFDHRDTDKKYYHAGAAPGFCLRGITLIRSGGVGVSTDIGNIIPAETKKGNVVFNNGNIGGVYNNPTKPTMFTINQPHVITLIQNYHWNNAKGSPPGTIGVKSQSGKIYGPWQAKGSPGQGGVPNAYWSVHPNITLPAGTYTIIDSNPSTWAQNSGSNGAGHTMIEGYPASGSGNQQSGGQGSGGRNVQQEKTLTAELKNSSAQNVHIFVEGQDTFGSHNRITPNERKRISIKAPAQSGFITFNAGRNGQVLATCRWEYDPDTISGRIPVVAFNEPNKLSCVTGIR